MKSEKLLTGLAVGAVVALILIPKTRKMISEAVGNITDSFKDIMDKAGNLAQDGKNEIHSMADKTKNIAEKATGWQS